MNINGSILPLINNEYSLGMSDLKINSIDNKFIWKNIYSNNIYAYTNLFTENIHYLSDYRLKYNIQNLNNNFTVEKLNPKIFMNSKTNKQEIGLLAHEVEEHFPDLVNGIKDDSEYQSINYFGLISILINDIKNIRFEMSNIQNELNELKKNKLCE
jgi:hypothetical protein